MWFRRLLLSYLPVFFIVTMILFVVFFQTLNEQTRREAIKANEFLAQQVILFTDNSLKSIDHQVVREILTNSDVSRFFSRDSVDVMTNIQALKVIDDLKFNYPIIDSIYFVRLKDRFIFGDAPRSFDDFHDKAFIKQYEEQEISTKWTGERTYKAYSNSDATNVITLVREAPYNMRVKQGYFVVNVSLAKLKYAISQMYNSDISFVRMIDKEGHNLLGDELDHSATDAILSKYTSPYTGWDINSGILDKKGMKFALTFYNVWVVFALAVVIFGIVWVIYVTKRNYKPIHQLVSLIQTYSLKSDGTGSAKEGEFGFIQNTLESLMSETKQYQQQYREKLILQKKYHFHQVLEGNVQISDEEWISELSNYDLDVADKISNVYVMEIDSYPAFAEAYSNRDQSLLKFTLYSVIHEMAKNNGAVVWAEWTTDRRVSFILWLPTTADAAEKNESIIQACRLWIEQNVSFNITIGQGEPASSLDELRRSYEMANHCLQYKAVLGSNRIITVEDTVRPQKEIQEYFKTIYLLSQSLRLAEGDWTKHLTVFFDQIRESLLPRKEIESLMQFFIHHLEGELLELSKEYRNIWRTVQAELHELAKRWDNVNELQQGCSVIFEMMSEKMQSQRDSHSNKALIIEIRSYIEENYANSELSLDYLSAKFQLNAKYLSKMFKEEFGENFVDFLIGLRINNAKQMLLETQKSMQAISNEVGYYNYNSFNRAFKNVVGLSPRDFRKQLGDVN
ncbi:MAG: helix-turn-helix domain-containing protein [Bacillota bacterium]